MNDKKYPYISKFEDLATYMIYSDKLIRCLGHDNHNNQTVKPGIVSEFFSKNITREYLANTYGEVKSERHADFIKVLAEVNGIETPKEWRDHNKYFSIDKDGLWFWVYELPARKYGETLITIPEPPEGWNMSHYDEQAEEFEMKQKEMVMKENGDNLHFGGEDKCKEWPCVGDEVLISDDVQLFESNKFKGKTCKVIGICESDGKKVLTLKNKSLGLAAFNMGDWIKKPKTPEEELRDEIMQMAIAAISDSNFDLDHNCYYLASGLINKYNITKKPQ